MHSSNAVYHIELNSNNPNHLHTILAVDSVKLEVAFNTSPSICKVNQNTYRAATANAPQDDSRPLCVGGNVDEHGNDDRKSKCPIDPLVHSGGFC